MSMTGQKGQSYLGKNEKNDSENMKNDSENMKNDDSCTNKFV